MVRRVFRRFALTGALLTAVAAVMLAGQPAQAAASETTGPRPTELVVSGDDLEGDINVTAGVAGPELFQTVLSQVSWLSGNNGRTTTPMKEKLGPKYTVRVLIEDRETFIYDLYPLAEGGPRAYRPAKQPSGKTTAAWFFGRLNMPYTLRLIGVPLPEQSDVMTGGIGGGERINAQEFIDPTADIDRSLDQLRQMMLLNGAVILVITIGLGGISYLVRRRV